MPVYERDKKLYKEEVEAARKAVEPFTDEIAKFAREYGLSYSQDRKVQDPDEWMTLVGVESKRSKQQGRQEFSVSISHFCKPGCVSIRVYVDDLPAQMKGKEVAVKSDMKDNVPVKDLAKEMPKAIASFKKWVEANDAHDARDAEKVRMGTKFHWAFDSNEDERSFSCDLKDQDLHASIDSYDDGDSWVASIYSLKDNLEFTTENEIVSKAQPLILKLEKLLSMDRAKLLKLKPEDFKKALGEK